MKINENLIKISCGLIPISKQLELGEDITLTVPATVVKIELKDCQDGTVDRVAHVKAPFIEEVRVG